MIDLTIDAGHGGKDPGAIGPTGIREKDITLKLALKVGSLLTSRGVNVNYTRTDDRSVELSERAAFANAAKAKYFLSIHINSAANAAANGTETYAYAAGGQGEKLAAAVQKNLVAAIGLTNRGVKFANYAVLRETNMPAALTEVNFICNPKEEAMLKDEAFLNKAASGIAKGAIEFLGLKWEDVQSPEQPGQGTDSSNVPQWQKDAFKKLVDKKVITSPEFWEGRLGETITIGEVVGILANTL
ncbi:MAG: N-acetylmuramoyl-L-alanine amidase [Firmicutes bacterium]|nr:N-acetylmuramoyl-L-alanine amidase [Bacillota bacterium]